MHVPSRDSLENRTSKKGAGKGGEHLRARPHSRRRCRLRRHRVSTPRSKDKIQAQVGRRDTSKPRYFGDADPSPEAILSHLNYFLGVYLFISLNLILLCPPPPTLSPNSSLILLIRPYHL